MAHLYSEFFAPWGEKARWALDHHRIQYGYAEHVPLAGELALRIAARRWRGVVTIPLLVDGDERIMDSVGIARYAERHGTGSPLFPPEHEEAIAEWNERSDQLMRAGRAMLLPRMAGHVGALREQLPPFVPAFLRPVLRPLASSGVAWLMRKYKTSIESEAAHEARAREGLDALRAALHHREHLVGEDFTFADIAMATSLQFFLPVAATYIPLGPGTREAWTHPTLSEEYGELFAWRDRLYERFRRPDEQDEANERAAATSAAGR